MDYLLLICKYFDISLYFTFLLATHEFPFPIHLDVYDSMEELSLVMELGETNKKKKKKKYIYLFFFFIYLYIYTYTYIYIYKGSCMITPDSGLTTENGLPGVGDHVRGGEAGMDHGHLTGVVIRVRIGFRTLRVTTGLKQYRHHM